MKSWVIISCLVALNLPALADTAPELVVQSGSSSLDIVLSYESNGLWGISAPATYTLGKSSFTLDAVTLDIDPSVHYAIGVTNDDSATGFTPYTFTFTTPTVLTPGQYAVSASLAGSLTDGANDGMTLKATASGPVQQGFIGTSDAGVDLLPTQVSFATSPYSQPFGPFTASSTYTLAATASPISVTTSFDLSGNDSASLSGRFDVNAVPEPPSVVLGLFCIGAFFLFGSRLRRTA
jgi:hypothetical protein